MIIRAIFQRLAVLVQHGQLVVAGVSAGAWFAVKCIGISVAKWLADCNRIVTSREAYKVMKNLSLNIFRKSSRLAAVAMVAALCLVTPFVASAQQRGGNRGSGSGSGGGAGGGSPGGNFNRGNSGGNPGGGNRGGNFDRGNSGGNSGGNSWGNRGGGNRGGNFDRGHSGGERNGYRRDYDRHERNEGRYYGNRGSNFYFGFGSGYAYRPYGYGYGYGYNPGYYATPSCGYYDRWGYWRTDPACYDGYYDGY